MNQRFFLYLLFCLCLNITGYAQWSKNPSSNLVIASGNSSFYSPKISITTGGQYYISWICKGSTPGLMINLYDKDGYSLWGNSPVKVNHTDLGPSVYPYSLISDGQNNALLGYSEIENGLLLDVVVKMISPTGEFIWGNEGFRFLRPNHQDYHTVMRQNKGGETFICFVSQEISGENQKSFLVIQKFNPNGEQLWAPGGIEYKVQGASIEEPSIISLSDGGCFIIYFSKESTNSGYHRQLCVQRMSPEGLILWGNPLIIKNNEGFGTYVTYNVDSGPDEVLYIVWNDFRPIKNSYSKIFIQGVHPSGELFWANNGLLVSTDFTSQHWDPVIIQGSKSQLFIFWRQSDAIQSKFFVKGQKVSINGQLNWSINGLEIDNQQPSGLIETKIRNDTVFLLYKRECDDYTETQLIVKRIDSLGSLLDSTEIMINNECTSKAFHFLSPFSNDQAIAAWVQGNSVLSQNVFFDGTIGIKSSIVHHTLFDPKRIILSRRFDNLQIRIIDPEPGDRIIIYSIMGVKLFEEVAQNNLSTLMTYKGIAVLQILDKDNRKIYTNKVLL